MRLTKEQYDQLQGYAAMLANAEMVTMGTTDEPHSYSLEDIQGVGSAIFDILEAIEWAAQEERGTER